MKALRFYVLLLMFSIGLTAYTQPGSYYPPPANVEYHNDTLTICPPDSLPGEPVVLLGYNINIDSVFYDNVPITDPGDTIDFIFDFSTLFPGDHEFCAYAVYNQWISEPACDSGLVIYGYELPFLEDWSSGNFEEKLWIPSSGNWTVETGDGNPAPAVRFSGMPAQHDYSVPLQSYAFRGDAIQVGSIIVAFDIKLSSLNSTGNEKLIVQYWDWYSCAWHPFAAYTNLSGSFEWLHQDIRISPILKQIFKIRFVATGLNSADIASWSVDNIHIFRTCLDANELEVYEHWEYNELSWSPPIGCGFDAWIQWDDGVNAGNSIGTGGAVEFEVAARWTPAQLTYYEGLPISQVAFFPAEAAATYNIRVWVGAGPDTMIVDQPITDPVIGEWNYVILTTPVPLDITQELWVGYHVNTTAGYPAGVDDGPAIDGYGNMMYYDSAWNTLLEINPDLDYNWNIACMLGPYAEGPEVYFNIYRQTNFEGFQFLNTSNQIEYQDYNIVLSDIYCYKVTMMWIKNGDTCESAPTNTACEVIMLGTNQPEQEKTLRVFPNPTKNWLNIEADEEIRIVKFYNLLGEMILEEEVNQEVYHLDVNGLQDGIYYVTVVTEKRDFKVKVVILR